MVFRRTNESGFSLIEVSIVLLIVSIIMVPLLWGWNQYLVKQKGSDSQAALQAVQSALIKYQARNGAYPVPENPNTSIMAVNPGQQATGPFAACVGNDPVVCQTAGVNSLDAGAQVLIGTVPYAELGLPIKLAVDGYHNKLKYAVTLSATVPGTFNETGGGIEVDNIDGTTIYNVAGTPRSLYFVASMGEDGAGAFTKIGGLVAGCAAVGLDTANCDQNGRFRNNLNNRPGASNMNEINLAAGPNHFDDFSVTANSRGGGLWAYVPQALDIQTNQNGNVGVGYATNYIPLSRVDVNGTAYATGEIWTKRICDRLAITSCVEPETVANYIPGLGGMGTGYTPEQVVGAREDSFYPDGADINSLYVWNNTNKGHTEAGIRCIRNRPWTGITPVNASWDEVCSDTISLSVTTSAAGGTTDSSGRCLVGTFAKGVQVLPTGTFILDCVTP